MFLEKQNAKFDQNPLVPIVETRSDNLDGVEFKQLS